MKTTIHIVLLRLLGALLFFTDGLMADPVASKDPSQWVTIQDQESGLVADFPHFPLEMEWDIPFQNTPPSGHVHLYSMPTQTGVLILSTLHSLEVTPEWIHEKKFKDFLDTILIPHLFYQPKTFYQQQVFHYTPESFDEAKGASFQISYQDHDVIKQMEGRALVKDRTLCLFFYLGSKKTFDQELYKRFLNSVHFI